MASDTHLPTGRQNPQPSIPDSYSRVRPRFALGDRILDRYEIFGAREGGFGLVYLVTDLESGVDYAAKTYKPEFATSDTSVSDFKDEVAFWISLGSHPNIVDARFVQVVNDQPYLFMEYVDGGPATSLRERLRHGRLSWDEAVGFAYQLCLGMEFANQAHEIVHCDLKPENLLVNRQGVLKVSDFGLVRQVALRQGAYPTAAAGTWAYAAPEHVLGLPVNSQADIYSFGVIFYEMLTGWLPYPFVPDGDPSAHYRQLQEFHSSRGMHDVAQQLYYGGAAELGTASEVISGCVPHHSAERIRDFASLRRILERQIQPSQPAMGGTTALADDEEHQRARSLHRIGRHSEALSVYNRLLQARPEEPQLWLEVARVLVAIGQRDSATTFLAEAVRLDPTLAEVRAKFESGEPIP